ncbi:MAG: (2Fe-2S) ferredoxin domain-containing protein [Thermodesulfobacteriota bacterium]
MKSYRLHVFVCQGKRCSGRGSERLLDALKEMVSSEGLKDEIRISKSGCLKVCKETDTEGELCPTVVVYPEGVWYRNISRDNIGDLFEEHIKNGRVMERFLHFKL